MDTRELWKRAQRDGTPLIDGERVTFVWRGRNQPRITGDWTRWEDGPPAALASIGVGLWSYEATFPPDAYVEYAFVREGQPFLDPLNARVVHNGLNGRNNYFYMPEAGPTPLARQTRIPHGTLSRYLVSMKHVVGSRRLVYLYRPPSSDPAALLVVFDGAQYLRHARLPTIVDNLIVGGRIPPLALAFVANAGRARFVEYGCSESVPLMLLDAVLPLAQRKLNLLDIERNPGAFGLLGASLGGLISFYTALRLAALFGRVLSQSGAFTLYGQDAAVYDLVREGPVRPLRIWMDCGRFEHLLETNRRLHARLESRGYDVKYEEYDAGHHWTAWRNEVGRGLEWLFGKGA